MSMKYKYAPLTEPDGIRLIELQPALESSAPIRYKLVHANLSRFGGDDILNHYMALSYVWGCPDKTRRVWINGTSLEITANLFSALCNIPDETRALLLWADGICINQSDSDEKRLQIAIMGQIYSGALHTIIYLGLAAIDSAEFQCITALRQSCN
ncbi:HET-domain-containing protein [Cenococcum geophilum 1.58]|uniref:HET-domain-containing protein n=1 Tax=Cenococcum geophilum 1.58 TaxID=794803 RepID=UPI00358F4A97|nr:HET-domain-containing protein [Cenococcum geophilum 1.58]